MSSDDIIGILSCCAMTLASKFFERPTKITFSLTWESSILERQTDWAVQLLAVLPVCDDLS